MAWVDYIGASDFVRAAKRIADSNGKLVALRLKAFIRNDCVLTSEGFHNGKIANCLIPAIPRYSCRRQSNGQVIDSCSGKLARVCAIMQV